MFRKNEVQHQQKSRIINYPHFFLLAIAGVCSLSACHVNFEAVELSRLKGYLTDSSADPSAIINKKKKPKKQKNNPPVDSIAAPNPGIFMNKFELRNLYLGVHWGQSRAQTLELARKAMVDAQKFGFRAFRVNITGFHANDLDYWAKPENKKKYWEYMDEMMADLNKFNIKIIPVFMLMEWQFPKFSGDGIHEFLTNSNSKSSVTLFKHTEEFVRRYQNNPAILFWELCNELNLAADFDYKDLNRVDPYYVRSSADNYSTEDLILFLSRFAQFVRKLDPNHRISSGLSVPRPYAQHLRLKPSWSPGGADGTYDSYEEFKKYFADVNVMADIMSVHLYNSCYNADCTERDNYRFGATGPFNADYLNTIKQASDEIGKPLFIGEFGALSPTLNEDINGSFLRAVAAKIVELKIPYSAAWDWEDYRGNPTDTANREPLKLDSASMSPESHEGLVRHLAWANSALTFREIPLLHSFQSTIESWTSNQDLQRPALAANENFSGDFGKALELQTHGTRGEIYVLRNSSFDFYSKLSLRIKVPSHYQGQWAAVVRIQTGDEWHYVNTPWSFRQNQGEWVTLTMDRSYAESKGALWTQIRSYGISISFDRPYEGPLFVDAVELN